MAEDHRLSSYLAYLPALLRQGEVMGRFLLAFERILSSLPPLAEGDQTDTLPDPDSPGLEEIIGRLPTYTDAMETPTAFLPWLASWVALSLREDWEEPAKRRLISRMVSLYRYRGTRRGLKDLLETYTNEEVFIYEFDEPAHYFQVEMTLSVATPAQRGQIERIARAIIEQEKPAHTVYALRILTPTMRIQDEGAQDPKPHKRGIWISETTLLGTTTIGEGAL